MATAAPETTVLNIPTAPSALQPPLKEVTASWITPSFTDVAADAWYAPYVTAAAQAGIVQGVAAGRFDPDAPVTREQMALMLARALKLSGTGAAAFTDQAAIAAWAAGGVQAAVAAGLMNGFPDGSFRPLEPTTRAQAAKVLALAIARMAPPAAVGGGATG